MGFFFQHLKGLKELISPPVLSYREVLLQIVDLCSILEINIIVFTPKVNQFLKDFIEKDATQYFNSNLIFK